MTGPVEAVWIALTLTTAVLTVLALRDAHQRWNALRKYNGSARGIVARANIFEERVRLYVQVVLFVLGVPSLFRPGDVALTPFVVLFLTIAIALFLNTIHARTTRQRLDDVTEADLAHERDILRMEKRLNVRADDRSAVLIAKVEENTEISREAYHEANSVNEKIASQGAVIVEQGEHAAADRLTSRDTNETAHRIDERVP